MLAHLRRHPAGDQWQLHPCWGDQLYQCAAVARDGDEALLLQPVDGWVGQFTESVRLIGPDQTTVLRKSELKFALQDVALHATNVTVLGQVKFESAGAYYVEILVDDVMKIRFPLVVNIVQPPDQKKGGGPTAMA